MKPVQALSAFIAAEPGESLAKRTAAVLLPGATIGSTAFLAVAAVAAAGHGPLPQRTAETLIAEAGDHAGINIQAAVYAGVMLYVGEAIVMSIVERLMKPLIAAGEARGEERGKAKAQAEFEAWKQEQRDRGAIFVDDDEGSEENRGR